MTTVQKGPTSPSGATHKARRARLTSHRDSTKEPSKMSLQTQRSSEARFSDLRALRRPLVTTSRLTDRRRGERRGRRRGGKDARCSNIAASGVWKAVLGAQRLYVCWRGCAREHQPSHGWRAGEAPLEDTREGSGADFDSKRAGELGLGEATGSKAQRHQDHDHGLQEELKSRNQRVPRSQGEAAGSTWGLSS